LAENDAQGEWTLPDGWVWTTLGEVTEPSKEKVDPQGIQSTRYIGLEHIEKASGKLLGFGHSDEVRSTKTAFHRGDLLYGKLRPYLNKVHLADFDGVCSTDILVFPGNPYVSNKYLLYRLLASDFVTYANLNVTGVQHPRTNFRILSQFLLALPPAAEQHRIVAEIETQFTRLDASVPALERAQANIRRYKASVLQVACEGRLVPTEAELARAEGRTYEPADQLLARILAERRARWEAEQWRKEIERAKKKAAQAKRKAAGLPARIRDLTNEEWQDLPEDVYARYLPKNDRWKQKYKEPTPPDMENLPDLPEGWVWATVSDVGEVVTGTTPRKSKAEYYGEDYPFYKPTDLNDGYHTKQARDGLSRLGIEKARLLPAKSILVTCIGATIGKTGFIRREGASNQQINAIVPEEAIVPEFIYFVCVSSQFQNSIIDNASSTTLPILNKSRFESLLLPLPPRNEQQRIVAKTERRLSVVEALETSVEAALARAGRLRQSILKRAFEGRLVTQDPADEAASELLKRIKASRERLQEEQRRRRTAERRQRAKQEKRREISIRTSSELRELLRQLQQQTGGLIPVDQLLEASKLAIEDFHILLKEEIRSGRIGEHRDGYRAFLEIANENQEPMD